MEKSRTNSSDPWRGRRKKKETSKQPLEALDGSPRRKREEGFGNEIVAPEEEEADERRAEEANRFNGLV